MQIATSFCGCYACGMGLESRKQELLDSTKSIKPVELLEKSENIPLSHILLSLDSAKPWEVPIIVASGAFQEVFSPEYMTPIVSRAIPEAALTTLFAKLAEASEEFKKNDLSPELAFFGPQHEKISADSFYSKKFKALHRVINDARLNKGRYAGDFLRQMEDQLLQDGQMIDPNTLIEEVADTTWREGTVPPQLRYSALSGLNYTFSFNWNKKYEDAIVRHLDFKDPERYAKTGHFLELIQNLYTLGSELSFSEDRVPQAIERTIKRVVEMNQGSYLLNLRAQQLLDAMRGGDDWVDYDRVPFAITKDRFAWHREDGLYIADADDRATLSSLIEDLHGIEENIKPPQELVDEAIARGESYVTWEPDPDLMRQRREKYTAIERCFSKKLTYEDLVHATNQGIEDEVADSELHDFSYLMQKPVRESIEQEFRTTLSDLSLEDQHHLLMFLRTVEKKNASPVFLEATRMLRNLGALDLKLLRGGSVSVVRGDELSAEEQEQIKGLQTQRYGDGKDRASEGYTEETVRGAMAGLENAFEQKTSRFYIFKLDGMVVSCVRFDQLDDDGKHSEKPTRLYMATVMGDSSIAGGKLAEANAEAAFREEQKRGLPIYATSKPELPILEKYLEWGFVAGSAAMYKDLPILNIVWSLETGNHHETREKTATGGLSREEILARGETLNSDSVRFYVFPMQQGNGPLARPDLEAHQQAFAQHPEMVLTRLYYDANRGRYCGVYERESASEVLRDAA